jgi:hypothetical protein
MAKNCSILSQKVPKFELYKHNDELFDIYYGIITNPVIYVKKLIIMLIQFNLGTFWLKIEQFLAI